MTQKIKKSFFSISLFALFIAIFTPVATAGDSITFSQQHSQEKIGTIDIKFIDVSEKERSCVFKIDGKTVVVDKHETYDHKEFTLWVKDAYALRGKNGENDQCVVIISSTAFQDKKEEIQVKPAS